MHTQSWFRKQRPSEIRILDCNSKEYTPYRFEQAKVLALYSFAPAVALAPAPAKKPDLQYMTPSGLTRARSGKIETATVTAGPKGFAWATWPDEDEDMAIETDMPNLAPPMVSQLTCAATPPKSTPDNPTIHK